MPRGRAKAGKPLDVKIYMGAVCPTRPHILTLATSYGIALICMPPPQPRCVLLDPPALLLAPSAPPVAVNAAGASQPPSSHPPPALRRQPIGSDGAPTGNIEQVAALPAAVRTLLLSSSRKLIAIIYESGVLEIRAVAPGSPVIPLPLKAIAPTGSSDSVVGWHCFCDWLVCLTTPASVCILALRDGVMVPVVAPGSLATPLPVTAVSGGRFVSLFYAVPSASPTPTTSTAKPPSEAAASDSFLQLYRWDGKGTVGGMMPRPRTVVWDATGSNVALVYPRCVEMLCIVAEGQRAMASGGGVHVTMYAQVLWHAGVLVILDANGIRIAQPSPGTPHLAVCITIATYAPWAPISTDALAKLRPASVQQGGPPPLLAPAPTPSTLLCGGIVLIGCLGNSVLCRTMTGDTLAVPLTGAQRQWERSDSLTWRILVRSGDTEAAAMWAEMRAPAALPLVDRDGLQLALGPGTVVQGSSHTIRVTEAPTIGQSSAALATADQLGAAVVDAAAALAASATSDSDARAWVEVALKHVPNLVEAPLW